MSALVAGSAVLLTGAVLRRALDGAALPAPPLGGWAAGARAPEAFHRVVRAAQLPVDAAPLWTGGWIAVAVAGGAGCAVGGPALGLVVAAGVVAGAALVLALRRDRELLAVDAALPDVLDAVARALRTGATVPQALEEAAAVAGGRLRADLEGVLAAVASGVPFGRALDPWPLATPTPGVRLAAAALGVAVDAGGPAARAIDGVAATLRANLAVAGEIRAQSAQARLSALVIATAPLGFGALAAGTDARTAEFLLRTPLGLACLVLGLTLDAVAAWWMHRITTEGTTP